MKTIPGFHILVAIFSSVFILGCGMETEQVTEDEVVWAKLRVLDEYSETALQFANNNDVESLKEKAVELMSAAKLVAEGAPPDNVKQPEQVKVLQQDLTDLIVDDPGNLPPEELADRVHAIHSVVVKLMEAAGMPHVHDHDDHEGDDHGDHEGHDHDDHEDGEGHNH